MSDHDAVNKEMKEAEEKLAGFKILTPGTLEYKYVEGKISNPSELHIKGLTLDCNGYSARVTLLLLLAYTIADLTNFADNISDLTNEEFAANSSLNTYVNTGNKGAKGNETQ